MESQIRGQDKILSWLRSFEPFYKGHLVDRLGEHLAWQRSLSDLCRMAPPGSLMWHTQGPPGIGDCVPVTDTNSHMENK